MKTLFAVSCSEGRFPLLLIITGLLTAGCSEADRAVAPQQTARRDRPVIAVVNYPLAYFAERLGKDRVEVILPVPGDEDPAFWKPSTSGIRMFQEADLILVNGAGYAQWLTRASLPQSRVVNTSSIFKDLYIQEQETQTHSHGPEGEHSHGVTMSTTWLDPTLALRQAGQVRDALARYMPDDRSDLDSAFSQLKDDLVGLDAALSALPETTRGKPWLASHPVYQYLARRGQWNLKSLHWEPSQHPSEAEWTALGTLLKEHPAPWMLWEDTPQPETAQRLKQMGITVVVFHPCAHRPASGDFISVMQSNLQRLRKVLE